MRMWPPLRKTRANQSAPAPESTVKLEATSIPVEEADSEYSVQLARLAAIVESSDDAIVSKTLDGVIRSWNAGAARLFGYEAEEVIGKPITLIIPPDLQQEERQILEKLKRGERIDHFETMRITKDGRRIAISLTVSPIRNSRGQIVGASKVARDISERQRAQEALRASERQLAVEAEALVKLNEWSSRLWRCRGLKEGLDEMLTAAIELIGADQGYIQLPGEMPGVYAIAAHRGFNKDSLELFRAVSAEDDSACGRALRNRQRVVIEDVELDTLYEPLREVARAAHHGALVFTPLLDGERAPLGILSVHFRAAHRPTDQALRRLDLYARQASDFIQRCKTEQILLQSEASLREADRRKDEFLALLAHELRNPLAPIRYALATTKKAGRTLEQQKRAEEVIERQVVHMTRLLDDLLDVSRITRGTLELKKGRTELTSVLGAAIEAARPMLDAKQHTFSLDLPMQAVRLEADPVRLAQVFSNLVINAAKYTDAGGHIQLRAAQEGNEVVVTVRDNGIGISADMMPRLFTLFSQAHCALGRSEDGLGVGLALVRGLVTLHGGRVEARSDGVDKGSEFIVRLPLGVVTPEASDLEVDADRVPAAKLRIMVVDDNRDSAELCATFLELSGHQVKTAFTSRRALELAEIFQPHALLLDIGLPEVNGYELAQKIRATSWGQDVFLVAVTGWGQAEDRRRAFEAGFDQHLTKPIDPETVESLLQSIAAGMASAEQERRDDEPGRVPQS
ncbi:MAG TPA: PAS domain S-box protein [Steroidobacteraceae bacterium]|jgi:PAS domain S-box-containing protein|nr:PAS domain S-box protein [Steroidobacteraceae bacterium]